MASSLLLTCSNCPDSLSYSTAALSLLCVEDETGVCGTMLELLGRRMMRLYRIFVMYVGRSSSKVSYFFFSGMEADRNVKVVGGDVAVL